MEYCEDIMESECTFDSLYKVHYTMCTVQYTLYNVHGTIIKITIWRGRDTRIVGEICLNKYIRNRRRYGISGDCLVGREIVRYEYIVLLLILLLSQRNKSV